MLTHLESDVHHAEQWFGVLVRLSGDLGANIPFESSKVFEVGAQIL